MVIIQLQYSLTDSKVIHDVKNITQPSLHPTQPNPPKIKKNLTQPNPWMDPTNNQLSRSTTAQPTESVHRLRQTLVQLCRTEDLEQSSH